jgi:hypothetical protein
MPEVKLAYVITAHRNASQLLRLLRAIEAPTIVDAIVLHIDSKADPELHRAARDYAASRPVTAVIPSEKIIWGSWRLAHAQIRAVAEALRLSDRWDYCINLTAQDYPLKIQAQIAQALADGPAGANYLEVLDFAKATAHPRKRLDYWWVPWRGRMVRLWRRRRRPDFDVYWGSNYFALTRAACEHLVTSEVSRGMQKFFRCALCADELVFQNALMHGPPALRGSIVNKTFRKLTWDGGSHPKTYTIADREELLASDAWFARKFDESVDSRILDVLDEHVRSRTTAPVG